jgi:hypothetical protein
MQRTDRLFSWEREEVKYEKKTVEDYLNKQSFNQVIDRL